MEDICLKNMDAVHHEPPKSNHIKSTWSSFKEFASSSNLHGLKYFSEKISFIEKLFWAVTFIGSIILCSLLIYNVWYKWRTSPVIVSFNDEATPVWEVPFPAITVCPQVKCKLSVYNYTKMYEMLHLNDSLEENAIKKKFNDISTVCGSLVELLTAREVTDASLVQNIISVAPTIEDVMRICIFRGVLWTCKYLFTEVLTEEGLCFTFNTQHFEEMLNMDRVQQDFKYLNATTKTKDWSNEEGYTRKNYKDAYPRIGRQSAQLPDLSFDMVEDTRETDNNICNIINRGFKVYLHHPTDMPQSGLYYYAVLPRTRTTLATKFSRVSTADTLKSYSVETRQCYFPSDRKLKYFKVYTQSNCKLECFSNYTYEMCGCVWFHMPHDNSSNICSLFMVGCVQEASDSMANNEIHPSESDNEACNCLPACNSVTYDADVLKTSFDYNTYTKSKYKVYTGSLANIFKTDDSYTHSRLEVFFKETRFVSIRRSELFGTTDFLANCGGLLGLFMGFSFLSIVEIVYFLIIRVLSKKYYSKNNKIESTSTNQTTRTTRSEHTE